MKFIKLFYIFPFLSFFLSFITNCSEPYEINNKVEEQVFHVSNIDDAVTFFQNARNNGLSIKSIQPLSIDERGWNLIFSDNSSLNIYNGEEAQTPYVSADSDGYWCVSYNNHNTSRITNNQGEYIQAQFYDGILGRYENHVSVAVSDDDFYSLDVEIIDEYSFTESDTIYTDITASKSQIIQSICEDGLSQYIKIILANGDSFSFQKDSRIPTTISILSTSDVELGENSISLIDFCVKPNNAYFNYDVNSDNCEISIKIMGSGNNFTDSPNYTVFKVEKVYDEQGLLKVGQYRAYIQDLGVSNKYKDVACLVVNTNDYRGENQQIFSNPFNVIYANNILKSFKFELSKNHGKITEDITVDVSSSHATLFSPKIFDLKGLVPTIETNGSSVFANDVKQVPGMSPVDFSNTVKYTIVSSEGVHRDYNITVSNTGLPLVVIDTENQVPIKSKTEWLTNTSITIYNNDGSIYYNGIEDNIRGRGNSTWGFPKKSYAIKLNKKAEILGMPKHKRWVLLANWKDRTLLRNDVAFQISKQTCLDWTPRGQFVEVILNGTHIGNYYLCEQIKVDKNRVNINELHNEDTDEDIINGGYIMELDSHFDEVNKFKSSTFHLPYMFKDPDEEVLNEQQFAFMENYINAFEKELYNADSFSQHTYMNYIDIDSFIDFFLINEIVGNGELCWPRSVYMHKNKGEKMKAGPVWDFDWATFMPGSSYGFIDYFSLYYSYFIKDPQYVIRLKERWNELYPNFITISSYIDRQAEKLRKSQEVNIKMWPISHRTNGDETMTFTESIERMKTSVTTKINWLNNAVNNL